VPVCIAWFVAFSLSLSERKMSEIQDDRLHHSFSTTRSIFGKRQNVTPQPRVSDPYHLTFHWATLTCLRAFSTEYPYDEEKKKTDYLPVTVNLQDSKVIVDEAPAEEEIVHKSPIFRWLAASLPSSSSGFNR
jgi:hypothetical protein